MVPIVELAVVGQLGRMEFMVEQHIVAQHKPVVRMGFAELIVGRPLVFGLVVEHILLVVARQLVLVVERLFSLVGQFVSWQKLTCSI